MNIKAVILSAIGGGAGTSLRYLLTFVLPQHPFAFATLAANLGGSFLLAFLTAMWTGRMLDERLKPLLGTGFCGGFTTMSTFSGEVYHSASVGTALDSAIYLFCSLFGGLIMGMLGYVAGDRLMKRQREGGM